MKRVSYAHANLCERAIEGNCCCRCGGSQHGMWVNNGGLPDGIAGNPYNLDIQGRVPLAYFHSLPADHSHHIASSEARREEATQAAAENQHGHEEADAVY